MARGSGRWRSAFGGDYNPEQWPERDLGRGRRADARGRRRPSSGRHLRLGAARADARAGSSSAGSTRSSTCCTRRHRGRPGHRHRLAAAVAVAARTPRSLPVDADGTGCGPAAGRRLPELAGVPRARARARRAARRALRATTRRWRMWHVNNEYGCHDGAATATPAPRRSAPGCSERYGDLDALNDAWGTAFWSQRYGDWDEILPPRAAPTFANPTQQLDFRRFSSDELLAPSSPSATCCSGSRPAVPVTTNFMVGMHVRRLDYWRWAPRAGRRLQRPLPDRRPTRDPRIGPALSRPTSPAASPAGEPWLLMEHSTSAVNWQPRNVAKRPGEMLRNSLAHVARGADGALFFQWRASRPARRSSTRRWCRTPAPTRTVWREVVELGADLERLAEVAGSRGRRPTSRIAVRLGGVVGRRARLATRASTSTTSTEIAALHARAVAAPGSPPTSCTRRPTCPATAWSWCRPSTWSRDADGGAHRGATSTAAARSLVTYFCGIVDENDHVRLGGYPGAFRDLLGVRTEEFFPLLRGRAGRRWTTAAPRRVDRAACTRRAPRSLATLRRRPAARRAGADPARRRHGQPPGTSPPGWTTTATAAAGRRAATRPACARRSTRPARGVEAVRRRGDAPPTCS